MKVNLHVHPCISVGCFVTSAICISLMCVASCACIASTQCSM